MEAALNSPYGRIPLGPAILAIGRSPDNQLVVNDPQASSHHAQIGPDTQGYLLTDIGSTNGTFVNEQRLVPHSPRLLNAGDVIRVGGTKFTYEISGVLQVGQAVAAPDQYGYQPTVAASLSSFDENNPPQGYPQQAAYPAYPQQPPNYQGYPPPPQQPYAPQAGQIGFPNYAVAPVQPQRKSRLGLWIGLAVVIVILVAAGVGSYVYLSRSTPDKTLAAFCNALKASPTDYQTAYNQFSARARNQESEHDFATGLQQALSNPALGGIKDCTVSNVQQNDTSATGTVTLTFNNLTNHALLFNMGLIDESDGWKIDAAPFKVTLAAAGL